MGGLCLFLLDPCLCFFYAHRHDAVGGDQPSALQFLVSVGVAAAGDQGVLRLEPLHLNFDAEVALGLAAALEGVAVLGKDTAEVIQTVGDAGDEVLDLCPVSHAIDAGLKDHLVVELLLVR